MVKWICGGVYSVIVFIFGIWCRKVLVLGKVVMFLVWFIGLMVVVSWNIGDVLRVV